MPWVTKIETSDGLVFGAHGNNHNPSNNGPEDGIILNASHLSLIEDRKFRKQLKEAILQHEEYRLHDLKIWEANEPKPFVRKPGTRTEKIWLRDQKTCRYCQREIDLDEAVAEHVIPKSKGGSNKTENLVCACSDCNIKKGARTPKEAGMKMLLMEVNLG